jgi:hypothetical protein
MRIYVPTESDIAYWSHCGHGRGYDTPQNCAVDPVRLGAAANAVSAYLDFRGSKANFICDGELFSASLRHSGATDSLDVLWGEIEEWLVISHLGPAPSIRISDLNVSAGGAPWFTAEVATVNG